MTGRPQDGGLPAVDTGLSPGLVAVLTLLALVIVGSVSFTARKLGR